MSRRRSPIQPGWRTQLPDGRRAIPPRSLHKGVEVVGQSFLLVLEEVAVDVHRDADLGVAHAFADRLRVGVEVDQQRGVRVAQVVRAVTFAEARAERLQGGRVSS